MKKIVFVTGIIIGLLIICGICCLCSTLSLSKVMDLGTSKICEIQLNDELKMKVIHVKDFELGSYYNLEFKYNNNEWQEFQLVYKSDDDLQITYQGVVNTKGDEMCKNFHVEEQGDKLILGNIFYSFNNGQDIYEFKYFQFGHTKLKSDIETYILENGLHIVYNEYVDGQLSFDQNGDIIKEVFLKNNSETTGVAYIKINSSPDSSNENLGKEVVDVQKK